jgi:hypothetical protein
MYLYLSASSVYLKTQPEPRAPPPHCASDSPPNSKRVDALEAVQLAQRQPPDPGSGELDAIARLHRLCVYYDDAALKARPPKPCSHFSARAPAMAGECQLRHGFWPFDSPLSRSRYGGRPSSSAMCMHVRGLGRRE